MSESSDQPVEVVEGDEPATEFEGYAHFSGEPDELTAAHVAALETELKSRTVRGLDTDGVQAELDRLRGTATRGKRTRLRGEGA